MVILKDINEPESFLHYFVLSFIRNYTVIFFKFLFQLVNDYLRDTYYSRLGITGRDINQLNIAACRLMLDIMPGLETSVVFQVNCNCKI